MASQNVVAVGICPRPRGFDDGELPQSVEVYINNGVEDKGGPRGFPC